MEAIRIGVIGAGVMGERHCRVCANLPRVDLVGIADLNEARGQEVADRYETTYYRDYGQLLPRLDAVTIATTTESHFDLAKACLEQGLHVMVEKPITETIEQAQQLIQMAEERGLVLQVGHIERFNPAFLELKNVTEGMHLIGVTMRRLSPFDLSNTEVDVIRDLMIHDLDLAVDLLGSSIEGPALSRDFGELSRAVEGLSAWGRSSSTTGIDHAVANLSFRGGPVVTLFASRVTEQKVRAVEVVAEGAYVEADLLNKSVLVHRRTFPQYLDNHNITKYRQESIIERIHVPMFEPLMLELRHFVDCVRENRPSQVPGSDGLRALQLAETVANGVTAKRS